MMIVIHSKILYIFTRIIKIIIICILSKELLQIGRAKYNIDDKNIIVTQKCSIEYEQHNYVQEEIIMNKIKSNNVTSDEMKEFKYQKFFFINTFINYPTLNYNEIAINLVNPFWLNKGRNI